MRSEPITMEQEIRDLEAELAAVRAERDQWKAAATARLAQDERIRGVVRMLGENPASVEAIESLGAKLVTVCAERDAAQETAAAFSWLAAQMHKGSLSVMAWPSEVTLHVWEGSTIRKFTGATLAEAVRAARKQQEGAAQ